jgi:hypothetical protein
MTIGSGLAWVGALLIALAVLAINIIGTRHHVSKTQVAHDRYARNDVPRKLDAGDEQFMGAGPTRRNAGAGPSRNLELLLRRQTQALYGVDLPIAAQCRSPP